VRLVSSRKQFGLSISVCRLAEDNGVPRNFFGGGAGGCSTNSVDDGGQRERGSGGGSPLVRGSGQLANE
jgi:hypothetical protein